LVGEPACIVNPDAFHHRYQSRIPLYCQAVRAHPGSGWWLTRESFANDGGSNGPGVAMSGSNLFWLAIPAIAILGWLLLGSASSHPRIDGRQARQLVDGGAKLVDVRTTNEFADRHLPAAINIPVQQLSERIHELEPKDQSIILYCRSGHRSGMAFDRLKAAGYTKLYDLGPMTAW
jgi:phage shock protein E